MSYARTFVTGDWTAGASESTLSIPASDHGLTGDIIDCQAFSLHYGAHVTNTWAAVQTYATNESDGSITLHSPSAYEGCVVLSAIDQGN